MRLRPTFFNPWILLLSTSLMAGCADDAEQPTASFVLSTAPNYVELIISHEQDVPVRLVSEIQYDKTAWRHVALVFGSSNPNVATLASLTPRGDDFFGYPNGSGAFGGTNCVEGAACFYSVTGKDEGDLVVKCHQVGTATISVDGTLTIKEGDGPSWATLVATHTAKSSTSFEVRCVEESGGVWPGCESVETEPVGYLGEQLTGDGSDLCAAVDTDVSTEPTVHSSNEVQPQPGAGDHTEIHARVAAQINLTQERIDGDASGILSCGEHNRGATFCIDPSVSPPPGNWLVVGNVTMGQVPAADPTYQYTYGFVFDGDGDPSNNYVADPAYPNDWYQDTDQWYELVYTAGGSWTGQARTVVGGTPTTMPHTAGRFVVIDNAVFLLVPADELTAALPDHRITVFRHPGDYGFGGDWSGDLEPPVADGLASFFAP